MEIANAHGGLTTARGERANALQGATSGASALAPARPYRICRHGAS
jgi:hypothetical protein